MASFNRVILMGNLTRDPDVRSTGASGTKVARLGLAVNERRKDRGGQEGNEHIRCRQVTWHEYM